jgi:hypothetical protein
MTDETTTRKKDGMSGGLKTVLATVSVGLITWAGQMIWSTYEKIETSQQEILKKIETLESDRARWASLAEMEDRMRRFEVQAAIMTWLLEHGKIAEVGKPGDIPLHVPSFDKLDPDEYHRRMEQKYKNLQQQKK